MQDMPTALWNLGGLVLQIEGVAIGGYAVRKLIFRKEGPFDSEIFAKNVFQTSTTSDDALIDEKTAKKVDKITVIDHKKAIVGISSIILGLLFQMIAVFTSNP